MIKYKLLAVIMLLSSFSCMAQKREIIKKSTIKLEKNGTNIRAYLDIDGLYIPKVNNDRTFNEIRKLIFFEDGTVCNMLTFKDDATEEDVKKNLAESLKTGIKKKRNIGLLHIGEYIRLKVIL